MGKYRSLIVIVFLSLAVLAGVLASAIGMSAKSSTRFAGDGYVLTVAESESGLEVEPLYFAAGTKYQYQYPDNTVFQDVRGMRYRVSRDVFLHYADGSVSAMTGGVVINLDDINGGLVNNYALAANTVMSAGAEGYTVENNGETLTFSNFLWKLTDSKFLMYSDSLELRTAGEVMPDVNGFLQIEYLEDGIIRLTTEDQVWQGVAAGSSAETSGGVSLSFEKKVLSDAQGEAKMTLDEVLLDADDNIKVQSLKDWVPPKFEFTTIDGQAGAAGAAGETGEAGENGEAGQAGENGTDGEEGEDGEDGEEGAAGEDGEEGDEGESGQDGKNGSAGDNGADGARGVNGTIPQNDTQAQATITLSDFDLDSGNASGVLYVVDDDDVLKENTGLIQVIEVGSNAKIPVYITSGTAENVTFADGDEISFSVENLNPDTEYRLVVSSGYELNDVSGSKDFVNRTFYTDSSGVFLNLETAGTHNFTATVTRKAYAKATHATITIKDSSGVTVGQEYVTLKDGSTEVEFDLRENGGTISDYSNASYNVTMAVSGGGTAESETEQTWQTLKQTPVLGTPAGNVNSAGYFELSANVKSDPDSAITGYYYTVYHNGAIVKRTPSPGTTDKNINYPLYLEDGVIERGQQYQIMVTAVYYDNEKTMEITSELSESFRMGDEGDTLVYFEDADENDPNNHYYKQTEIRGNLVIKKNNISSLYVNDTSPLTVVLESSGNYRKSIEITSIDGTDNTITIPLHYDGLKADTNYRLAVWAYVEELASDGTSSYRYTLLGDYLKATTSYSDSLSFELMSVTDTSGATIAARMQFTGDPDALEAKALGQLRINLYNGMNSSGTLVGTYVVNDTNPAMYESSISDAYYNKTDSDDQLLITNNSFGLQNNSLTGSQYYMEVVTASDYTVQYDYDKNQAQNISGYANEMPIHSAGVVLPVNTALPSLPDSVNNAVYVTAITNGDLGSGDYTGIKKIDGLEDDTIVGYILQGLLNNDMGYARSVRYYGFKASEIENFDKSMAANPIEWDSGSHYDFCYTVPADDSSASLPSLRILFLDAPSRLYDPDMSLTDEEKNMQKGVAADSSNRTQDNYGGIVTVFTGANDRKSLGRGYHYVFGFNVRMEVNGTTVIYPDEYKAETVEGCGMLRSQVIDAPKQSTQVKMYLDRMEDKSVYWNMKVSSDQDGTWKKDYNGEDSASPGSMYYSGLRVVSSGQTPIPGLTEKGSDRYEIKIPIPETTTDLRYQIKMYQDYYNGDDQYQGDSMTANTGQILATHQYLAPLEWDPKELAVTANYPNNSNTVEFTVMGSTARLNRIASAQVTAWDADTNEVLRSYPSSRNLSMSGSARTFSIDLTSIEDVTGKEIYFTVEFVYDSGDVGLGQIGSMKTGERSNEMYAARLVDQTAYYNHGYFEDSATNSYKPQSNKSYSHITYGGYYVRVENAMDDDGVTLRLWSGLDWAPDNTVDNSMEMPLVFGQRGSEYLEGGAAEGSGDLINFSKLLSYAYDKKGDIQIVDGSGSAKDTIQIGSLSPAISNWTVVPGITSVLTEFSTSSFALIQEENDGKRYMDVSIYEVGNSPDIENEPAGDPVYTECVEISDKMSRYQVSCDALGLNKNYMIIVRAKDGEGKEIECLYSSSKTGTARRLFQTLENIKITNQQLVDVNYSSYNEKNADISYELSQVRGFDIKYTITKYALGTSSETNKTVLETIGHGDVMGLMGYTWDETGNVWKNADDKEWNIASLMKECLSLKPGSLLKPGFDYVLGISAVDQAGEVVSDPKVAEILLRLVLPSDPITYLVTRLVTGTGTDTIWLDARVTDEYKTVVDGTYIIAWRESGSAEKWNYVEQKNVGALSSIVLNGIDATKSYEVGAFAVTDKDNTGEPKQLGKDDFEKMTVDQQMDCLLGRTEYTGLESWGGAVGDLEASLSGGSVVLTFYNSTHLDKITKIEYSAFPTDGTGTDKSGALAQTGGVSLFTSNQSGSVQYSTVALPAGLSGSSMWTVTIRMYAEVGGRETVIYSATKYAK